MKGPAITVLMTAFCLLLTGKLLAQQETTSQWVSVAVVNSQDWLTMDHIHELLDEHHIMNFAMGSRAYSIAVPAKDQQQAIRLIMADAPKRHYTISISSEHFRQRAPSEKEWEERRLDTRYRQLLRQPDFRASTTLGRFLRYQEIKHLAVQYPYVVSIQYLPRPYLDTDGKEHVGYELKINMTTSLHLPMIPWSEYYLVWKDGKEVKHLWEGNLP